MFSVRRAEPGDAETAVEVVRRSIVELCAEDHRGDADTLARWLANKTVPHFVSWVTSNDNYCVVAEAEGRVTGVGVLKRSGEIALVYMAPDAQGRGMGRAVHEALEEQARTWDLRELHLESTVVARSFYERLGYRATGDAVPRFGVLRSYPYVKALQPDPAKDSEGASRNLTSISPFFIVKDLQTSIAYYREHLGFQLDFQGPEDGPHYAGVSRDGIGIMLKAIVPDVLPCPNHTRHEWARWDAYIYTLDPDALFDEFSARGASVVKTLSFIDEGLWGFEIADADGYVLAFFQLRDR